MSFDFDGVRAGELRFVRVQGGQGLGTHDLAIELEADWDARDPGKPKAYVMRSSASLAFRLPGSRGVTPSVRSGDTAHGRQVQPYRDKYPLYFSFSLHPHQLEFLEKRRDGGSVIVEVDVRLEMATAAEPLDLRFCGATCRHELNAEAVAGLLEQAGFRKQVFLGIDVAVDPEQRADAERHFLDAEKAFREGRTDDVLKSVRQVAEAMRTGSWPKPSNDKKPDDWLIDERYWNVAEAVHRLTAYVPHSGSKRPAGDRALLRPDAKAALCLAAALLERLRG